MTLPMPDHGGLLPPCRLAGTGRVAGRCAGSGSRPLDAASHEACLPQARSRTPCNRLHEGYAVAATQAKRQPCYRERIRAGTTPVPSRIPMNRRAKPQRRPSATPKPVEPREHFYNGLDSLPENQPASVIAFRLQMIGDPDLQASPETGQPGHSGCDERFTGASAECRLSRTGGTHRTIIAMIAANRLDSS